MLSTNTIVIVAKKVLKPNLNNEFYISGESIKKTIKTSIYKKNENLPKCTKFCYI